MKIRFFILAAFAAAIGIFSLLVYTNDTMVLATRSSGSLIEDVGDSTESQHPSGNDRNIEPGKSGTQGKSTSNPDGDGADKRRSSRDGSFGGTQGNGDWDDNNGCGNDNDFADDNNGNCGGKSKTVSPSPKPSAKPSPKPSHSPRPSSTPGPIGGTTTNNTNNNNQSQTQTQTQNNNQTVNVTVSSQNTGKVLGAAVPTKLPETGLSLLGFATMLGAAPVGLVLTRFGRGRIVRKEEDLAGLASSITTLRQAKKISL